MSIFEKNRALLDAFRRGDKEALSAIYYFYVEDIERMVRRGYRMPGAIHLEDAARQQDLIQEIFIRAFSESARLGYDGLRPYRPYLFSIAKNVIIDFLRKLPKDSLAVALNTEDDEHLIASLSSAKAADEEENQEQGIHWERCIAASREYVSSLPHLQQTFVELRFRQEMPQLSVAKQLKLSRWKVRALEKKIQTGLKKHLIRTKLIEP